MSIFEPTEKSYLRFLPSEETKISVANKGFKLYSDDFKILINNFNSTGRKILVVTDQIHDSDFQSEEIASGREGEIFDNVLSWAMRNKKESIDIKQVVLFNWQFAVVPDKETKPDNKTIDFLNDNFYSRLYKFIMRYKPDAVVLCGVPMFNWVYNKITGKFNIGLSNRLNRVLPASIDGFNFKVIGTVDLNRPSSWDVGYTKEFPSMLGYLGKGLIAGLEGSNRYTIKLPHKDDIAFNYIHKIEQFDSFYKKLCKKSIVSIDLEGKNLAKLRNRLYSAQFCWGKHSAYFIPLYHPDTPFTKDEVLYIIKKLKTYFERGESDYHIYQNGKFDISVMHGQFGIRFYNHRVFDTQGGHFSIDENIKNLKKYSSQLYGKIRPYSLDFIAEQYGCRIYSKLAVGKADRTNLGEKHLPSEKDLRDPKFSGRDNNFVVYGCYDVLIPFYIAELQQKVAEDFGQSRANFINFVVNQLSDTTLSFAQMEFTGSKIDKKELYQLNKPDGALTKAIEEKIEWFKTSKAAQKVNKYLCDKRGVPNTPVLWGEPVWLFKINKPAHQQLLFFNALKLDPLSARKDGGGKIDKRFQKKYKEIAEVSTLSELKGIGIIKSTFVNALIKQMKLDPDAIVDFRVRSSYLYITVVTGRVSSIKPNRQNIPARGSLAKIVKRLDIAKEGCILVENDYSAHEVRDWANESGDKNLAKSFLVGLQFRQKIRFLSYSHPKNALKWSEIKAKHEWSQIKGSAADIVERKTSILNSIRDSITKEIASTEFELEQKGDVHKNNAELFFNTPVLEVTDTQRYDIKAVVFGTIYGKGAASLGTELSKDEAYAQNLQDTLFKKFPVAAKFLTEAHKTGRRDLMIETYLGMMRHLWGYLHNRPAVQNGEDRRGPNSKLQGMASQIGVASMRIMQKLIWNYYVKHGVDFYWKCLINFVHDSIKGEVPYAQVPLYLYLMEHASTTLIHKHMEKTYGYKMIIGLELEFGLGATMSHSEKFNFMPDNLLETMRKEMEWQKSELGYKVNYKVLDTVKDNWDIISDLRRREIKIDRKSNSPATIMLMTEKNARNLGLVM